MQIHCNKWIASNIYIYIKLGVHSLEIHQYFLRQLANCKCVLQAAAYCKDIEKQEGYQAWIIGIVEKGLRTARIIDKPRVIEVPAKEKDGELW